MAERDKRVGDERRRGIGESRDRVGRVSGVVVSVCVGGVKGGNQGQFKWPLVESFNRDLLRRKSKTKNHPLSPDIGPFHRSFLLSP